MMLPNRSRNVIVFKNPFMSLSLFERLFIEYRLHIIYVYLTGNFTESNPILCVRYIRLYVLYYTSVFVIEFKAKPQVKVSYYIMHQYQQYRAL